MKFAVADYTEKWDVHEIGEPYPIGDFEANYYRNLPWLFPGCRLRAATGLEIYQECVGDSSLEKEYKPVNFKELFGQLTERAFSFPDYLEDWVNQNAEDV